MISDTLYSILKYKDPASKNLEKSIFKNGVITGSSVFGKFTDKSDIDIIIMDTLFDQREFEDICAYTQDYNEFDEFTSFYIKTKEEKILNLLIMHGKKDFNI